MSPSRLHLFAIILRWRHELASLRQALKFHRLSYTNTNNLNSNSTIRRGIPIEKNAQYIYQQSTRKSFDIAPANGAGISMYLENSKLGVCAVIDTAKIRLRKGLETLPLAD
ncbi:hypothetical protein CU098_010938 [Rhizopus stolonifer]|uniref:Uncharacterized protein n=1 Tax=Rhizopus stolonifer TaxID=4846 RepID=A0A367JYV3_RHIST|nr:hypothetical protein CU098_010938 [Rhizopus stolonifer]